VQVTRFRISVRSVLNEVASCTNRKSKFIMEGRLSGLPARHSSPLRQAQYLLVPSLGLLLRRCQLCAILSCQPWLDLGMWWRAPYCIINPLEPTRWCRRVEVLVEPRLALAGLETIISRSKMWFVFLVPLLLSFPPKGEEGKKDLPGQYDG